MSTKKRNIIIIVSCVLTVALVLSLSLGWTLGLRDRWFNTGEVVSFTAEPDIEILKTDVKVNDLSEGYKAKLSDFTGINVEDWRGKNIFRNYTSNPMFDESAENFFKSQTVNMAKESGMPEYLTEGIKRGLANDAFLFGQSGSVYNRSDVMVKILSAADVTEKTKITYVNGSGQLKKNEILVNKWVYYSLYARKHEISIDIDKVEEILDAPDSFLKHIILRNCKTGLYGMDGMALYHYGLLPENPTEEIDIVLYQGSGKNYKFKECKIVGFFEVEADEAKEFISKEMDVETINNPMKWDFRLQSAYFARLCAEAIMYIA